jgi:hypothetical protein
LKGIEFSSSIRHNDRTLDPVSAGLRGESGRPAQRSMILFQWLREILIGVLSAFFLVWGISLLISAYGMKNPVEFIMVFFASNFIVLISGTGVLYAAFRFWRLWKETLRPS